MYFRSLSQSFLLLANCRREPQLLNFLYLAPVEQIFWCCWEEGFRGKLEDERKREIWLGDIMLDCYSLPLLSSWWFALQKSIRTSWQDTSSHSWLLMCQAPMPITEEIGAESDSHDDKPLVDGLGKQKQGKKIIPWGIVSFGFCLAPIWFATEYLANAMLARTSVATTTVLFLTTGVFTLFIGAWIGQETINIPKVISVCVIMAGVAMTAFGKTASESSTLAKNEMRSLIVGYLFGLLSSMTHGLFNGFRGKLEDERKRAIWLGDIMPDCYSLPLLSSWWYALQKPIRTSWQDMSIHSWLLMLELHYLYFICHFLLSKIGY